MSGVRNFALLRRLRDLLQVEDTAQFPSSLNTDQIVTTVDLTQMGGIAELPAAPYQAYETDTWGESQTVIPDDDEINIEILPLNNDLDRRILNLDLQFTSLGAAAGLYQMALSISMFKDGVGPGYRICYLWPWAYTSNSAAFTRVFALHGAVLRNTSTNIVTAFASTWNGFLPAGYSLWASTFLVEVGGGTSFPATSNLTSRVNWLGVPKGRVLPGS